MKRSGQSICNRQTLVRFSRRILSSKGEAAVYGSNQAICWIACLHSPRQKGVFETRVRSFIELKAMPCFWAQIRVKQLSMAATARVIWLSACVRYWPGRGLLNVCSFLSVCLLDIFFFHTRTSEITDLGSEEFFVPNYSFIVKTLPIWK